MTRAIDLNADMGEYSNAQAAQREAELMALITSCSIACGGHAGDEATMRRTIRLAKTGNVSIGAHPAYPDREGFGRRRIDIDSDSLKISLRSQINQLHIILNEEKTPLRHIKPHGALYNDAAKDKALACLLVSAAEGVAIMGPPGSALESAAHDAGCIFIAEGFIDRLYCADGSLAPRTVPGAIIAEIDKRATQALAIASRTPFSAADGEITIAAKTICIHSDSSGAVETALAVRAALDTANISLAPVAIEKS